MSDLTKMLPREVLRLNDAVDLLGRIGRSVSSSVRMPVCVNFVLQFPVSLVNAVCYEVWFFVLFFGFV